MGGVIVASPHIKGWVRALLLGSALLAGFSRASEVAPNEGEEWRISLIPYYWVPESTLRSRFTGEAYRLDQSPELDDLTFNPQLVGVGFGAIRKSWGIMLEGESLDTEFTTVLPDGGPGEITFDTQRLGFAGVYEWQRTLYPGSRLFVSPWFGLRYRNVSLKLLDPDPPTTTQPDMADAQVPKSFAILDSDGSQWIEPLVGMRVQWFVTPKCSVSILGDVDGFISDQVSWTAASWLRYHWGKEFNVAVGYRYQDVDFSQGGRDGWGVDGISKGIVVGLEIDFLAKMAPPSEPWYGTDFGGLGDNVPRYQQSPYDETAQSDTGRVVNLLERGHDLINSTLDVGVEYVDTGLLPAESRTRQRKKTRFEAEIYGRITDKAEGGVDLELRPGGKIKVDLPNLTRGLKLIITDQSVDEAPGIDPFDREEGVTVGLEKSGLLLKKTKFRIGVRGSLNLSASAAWVPEWRYQRWRVAPEARTYYRTDKGAGAIGSVLFGYRIENRYRASHRASVEYGEETDGDIEWLMNTSFSYQFEGDEKDYHRALFTHFSVNGTVDNGPQQYEWSVFRYRAPLYKKWLYWETGPNIVWRSSELWEPELIWRFAVSALFWGTPER